MVVVIAFAACWSPFHIQRLLFSYIEPYALNRDLSFFINYGSGVLFYISTCINPFLYNIMSNKFREAFKVISSQKMINLNVKINGICTKISQKFLLLINLICNSSSVSILVLGNNFQIHLWTSASGERKNEVLS